MAGSFKNSKTILLIEDDHDNRVALRLVLESSGYQVLTAANGKLGLQALERMYEKKKLPDLILLDMVMPLMDGEEFLKQLEKDKKFGELKVIIITSHKEKLKLVQSKEWMLKPFDLERLVQRVEQFFQSNVPMVD